MSQQYPDTLNEALQVGVSSAANNVKTAAEIVYAAIQAFRELSQETTNQRVDLGLALKKIITALRSATSAAVSHVREYRHFLKERNRAAQPASSTAQTQQPQPSKNDAEVSKPPAQENVEAKLFEAINKVLSKAELPQAIAAWAMASIIDHPLLAKVAEAVEQRLASSEPELMQAYAEAKERHPSCFEAMYEALEHTALKPLRYQEACALVLTQHAREHYVQRNGRKPSQTVLRQNVRTLAKDRGLNLGTEVIATTTRTGYTPSEHVRKLAEEIRTTHPHLTAAPPKSQESQATTPKKTTVKKNPTKPAAQKPKPNRSASSKKAVAASRS